MSGFTRLFYAAAAAIAKRIARRRADSASKWTDRAERWAKKAALATTSPEKSS